MIAVIILQQDLARTLQWWKKFASFTSFSMNNCATFLEKKSKNFTFWGEPFFENTCKNFKLNLVLVLVLKSKGLY